MRTALLALILLLCCSGCWDRKEINQLAIVNIGAVDLDSKNKKKINVYLQVINPMGVSAKGGGSSKAAVYTYRFDEMSPGLVQEASSTAMPRRLFADHMQCYILSERIARTENMLQVINYFERDPARRTSITFLIADSPLPIVLNSFTPLETVPGRFLRSLMEQQSIEFGSTNFILRVKDVIEGIPKHQPTIVPILHYNGSEPSSSTSRLEEIDAVNNGLSIKDGAVIYRAKMVGRIDREMFITDMILNRKIVQAMDSLVVSGAKVDVLATKFKVKRNWDRAANRLLIDIHANLRIILNDQQEEMTTQNLHKVEQAFNDSFLEKAREVVKHANKTGWDLLGLQDQGVASDQWKLTHLDFDVQSEVTAVGNTTIPYRSQDMEE